MKENDLSFSQRQIFLDAEAQEAAEAEFTGEFLIFCSFCIKNKKIQFKKIFNKYAENFNNSKYELLDILRAVNKNKLINFRKNYKGVYRGYIV